MKDFQFNYIYHKKLKRINLRLYNPTILINLYRILLIKMNFFPVIIKDNKTINVSTKNCGNYYPRNYSNCIGVKNQTFKKGLYLSTNPYKGLSRTFLRLEDFNRTFTNDERIFIFYEMTITPNSHYTFELYNDLSSSVYDLETVDFYLGNNFFCNGICVSLTSDDFYESSAGSSQEIKLVSIDNETDFRKNFKIVGVIKKTKWLIKNAFFAIGASILASIIVLFFQYLNEKINLKENNHYKNNRFGYFMKKSNYKFFMNILEEVFENIEPIEENKLKSKYPSAEYKLFAKYFIEGINPIVSKTSSEKGIMRLSLSKEGLKFFLEMKENYRSRLINMINLQAVIGSLLFTVITVSYDKFFPTESGIFIKVIFVTSFLLMYGFSLYLLGNALYKFVLLNRNN